MSENECHGHIGEKLGILTIEDYTIKTAILNH